MSQSEDFAYICVYDDNSIGAYESYQMRGTRIFAAKNGGRIFMFILDSDGIPCLVPTYSPGY